MSLGVGHVSYAIGVVDHTPITSTALKVILSQNVSCAHVEGVLFNEVLRSKSARFIKQC